MARIRSVHPSLWTDEGFIRRFDHALGSFGAIEIDHVIPWSRGGAHELGNLAVACRACNQEKGDRTPEEMGWHHG